MTTRKGIVDPPSGNGTHRMKGIFRGSFPHVPKWFGKGFLVAYGEEWKEGHTRFEPGQTFTPWGGSR